MLWNNETRETNWGEAPKLTTVYNKALNIGNTVPAISTSFSGLVAADRFLVGSSPNDWKIGPGQGVPGDSLTWPETGSTAVWGVPGSVYALQEQCQYMTSEPLGTDFALRVVADSLVSNTTITLDAENAAGTYTLPETRGTPGQVLVAGGANGSQCYFEDPTVSAEDLLNLQSKTQNIQLASTEGITFFDGRVTSDILSSNTTIQVNESSPTGSYYLPTSRGTPGQVLAVNSADASQCVFQDPVLTPTDLSDLQSKTQNISLARTLPNGTFVDGDIILSERSLLDFTFQVDTVKARTQYQSTTELQDRLTTFDGRLRLQPVAGGDAKQVIFPDSRSNYGGSVLRTSMANQAELIWQFPSFIRRYRQSVFTGPTQFQIPALITRYTLMPILNLEAQSDTPTFQYYPNDGVAFLGASNHGMYRVSFSALIGLSTNPAPAQVILVLTHRASSLAARVDIFSRCVTIRKDADPVFVHLEGHGKNLTPGMFLDIEVVSINNLNTLEFYDASFEASVY